MKEYGKQVIYTACNKTIYSTMNATLLLYKKLTKVLRTQNIVMNLYDTCVWNGIEENKQLTIMYYADDLVLSSINPIIVMKYIKMLDSVYRSKDLLSVTRGKIHEYLSITINF